MSAHQGCNPSNAPKDGTQIIGDFGYPWAQVAAWDSHIQKWAVANMQAQEMVDGTTDIWLETEYEDDKQLKQWMPLPQFKRNKQPSTK